MLPVFFLSFIQHIHELKNAPLVAQKKSFIHISCFHSHLQLKIRHSENSFDAEKSLMCDFIRQGIDDSKTIFNNWILQDLSKLRKERKKEGRKNARLKGKFFYFKLI